MTSEPIIKIIRHARAKHMRLCVDANQVRLTVPKFCNDKQIQAFLAQHQQWLARAWAKQQAQLNAQTAPDILSLFDRCHGERSVYIQPQPDLSIWHFDAAQHILSVDAQRLSQHLRDFVVAYAKQHLPDYLQQVATQCGIDYQCCNIRLAKTRWGSCSQQHAIMLNASLVLAPEKVIRYVCIHELAHTRHFDHSNAFWAEVARHDPDFQLHRKALKQIKLPYWLVS